MYVKAYSVVFLGLLRVGTGPISESFTGFLNPTPHTESPCSALIHILPSGMGSKQLDDEPGTDSGPTFRG